MAQSPKKQSPKKPASTRPGRKKQTQNARSRSQAARQGRPGGRRPGPVAVRPATLGDWIGGARLRTLPLAIAPVALGTGAAHVIGEEVWHEYRIALCLIVALALQIGVNYANDYSDGIRGTDAFRVGPSRLTGSGRARPRTVLTVALVFFAIAAAAGLTLVVLSQQWWLLAVGAVAIAAAWFYTGGKRPYGYAGLGELFVFVFFGVVATSGSTFVQVGQVNLESWAGGVGAGLLACAVLMVNNIRDRAQDALAGKRTLAVRLGERASRVSFAVLVLLPFVVVALFTVLYPNALYVLFGLLAAIPAAVITLTARTPRELIWALQLTSLTALAYGVGLGAAIAF
ncbi:1,4-dihydroxy-2-naphthoate polyprenyltransferase [Galbitalea sp. SE-J8]|uniref:1,4-dihydroxy-2-naphthoate polyprenyltransferase n=1 Tax=Galbitalea sp. SE-J8 TaxID=3054952 RepID=UPI00259D2991|nr:1,4-dihydroxy-2-naphthoate polyprenyltransferase [Galbitalea sp. SE-J8]MDM4762404.1 1,4-dihydroxy-2-naphthoate polyprenyltransferase [Galbitalea sp. SE-J8]